MRNELLAVVDELKRLREEGVSSVAVSEEALTSLRQAVAARRGQGSASDSTPAAKERFAPVPEPGEQAFSSGVTAPEARRPDYREPVDSGERSSGIVLPGSAAPAAKKKAPEVKVAAATGPSAAGLPDFVKPIPAPKPFTLPGGDKQSRWEWLRERVMNDPVCLEHVKPDKKLVLGVGSLDADIFFCGEAPGADEETQGEPFVGAAGQLLTKIIGAMGLKREQVYIGNIMNWRPEHDKPFGNRKPAEVEMAYCLPHLKAQIEIVQPKVIVALGATAVDGLFGFGQGQGIRRKRGSWREFEGIPTIITFHPSYLLHQDSPQVKRQVWEDMLAVMEKLAMPISDKQRGYFT
ncbi:uracil-DNA glycosylase [Ruficoccus amylovorans]|uniref:Type-4 uracil-DNA glycosylase n=1 Tax=Ruficoccus amylovorans TaxID=1804625 RepID=A0A842HBA7_9BACT|nr:uracil-DNA glycosylase [Ruficoccus amylovorans]MBC2593560.1 uracil-DNA glycosylase [Ruficoccus amylovorans]